MYNQESGHTHADDISDATNMSILEWMNQFSDELVMEQLGQTNCINLQQMHEYCLEEIFIHLGPMDLCSVGETCKRFREIVRRIVPRTICIGPYYSSRYDVGFGVSCKVTSTDIERIFRNFGLGLSRMEINARYGDSFLLELLTKYCRPGKLKSLSMLWIDILDIYTVNLKPIFRQLQNLHLQYVTIKGNDATLFAYLDSLIDLRVVNVENCGTILKHFFPKIERFEYRLKDPIGDPESYIHPTCGTLVTFLSRHNSLNSLELDVSFCDDNCPKIMLDSIGNNCKELEKLYLRSVSEINVSLLQPLQTIKSLQALELYCMSFADFSFFSPLTGLRELILRGCRLPEDSDQFACLAQLKQFKMQMCSSIDRIAVIRLLTNLEVLTFSGDNLKEEEFYEIVDIVRGRLAVLTLKCYFDFNYNFDDNHNVRLLRH